MSLSPGLPGLPPIVLRLRGRECREQERDRGEQEAATTWCCARSGASSTRGALGGPARAHRRGASRLPRRSTYSTASRVSSMKASSSEARCAVQLVERQPAFDGQVGDPLAVEPGDDRASPRPSRSRVLPSGEQRHHLGGLRRPEVHPRRPTFPRSDPRRSCARAAGRGRSRRDGRPCPRARSSGDSRRAPRGLLPRASGGSRGSSGCPRDRGR